MATEQRQGINAAKASVRLADCTSTAADASVGIIEASPTFAEKNETFLLAREMYKGLGYLKWSNFVGVVRRAKQLIRNGLLNGKIEESTRRVKIGSGAYREIVDYRLDQQAVEAIKLITSSYKLNGHLLSRNETALLHLVRKWATLQGLHVNPQSQIGEYVYDLDIEKKVIIEFDEPHHSDARQRKIDREKEKTARTYGRKLLRYGLDCDIVDIINDLEHLFWHKRRTQNIIGSNMENEQYSAFENSSGIAGLYGGLDVAGIRRRKGLSPRQQILDHMGSTELAANLFRATQTEEKLRKEKIVGKAAANRTHFEVGQKVRKTIEEIGGDMPETLPTEEDIKKVGRRLAASEKKLLTKD